MRSPNRSPVAGPRSRPFDRHSGTGTRGLPKKNGAGAKGVWGAAMDQEGVIVLDKNDPNYDSDLELENQGPLPAITLKEPTLPGASSSAPVASGAATAGASSLKTTEATESAATSPAVSQTAKTDSKA